MADNVPVFVWPPSSMHFNEVVEAVQICIRLGLLNDPHGYLVMPPMPTVLLSTEHGSKGAHLANPGGHHG